MREVRLLQLISHPNVVELLEAFQSQSGRLYLVRAACMLLLLSAPAAIQCLSGCVQRVRAGLY